MTRKPFISVFIIFTFLIFGRTGMSAEESGKFRIGIASWAGYPENVKGFKESLAAEGLIEGQNAEFTEEKSGGDKKQYEIAERFKKNKLDLVYSLTTSGTLIMKEVMSPDTPIVFSIVSFPVKVGLIKSFERSDTNLVGTSNFVEPEYFIELLTAIMPDVKKVSVFRRLNEPNSTIQKNNFVRLLTKKGIQFSDLAGNSVEELREKAVREADDTDVFITTQDTLIQGGGEDAIIEVSLKKNVPILSSNKKGIENGATFGPVADFYTIGKMSGLMAAKILKEKIHPSGIKSQKQEPPLILINKKSAEMLGIRIPEDKLKNIRYVE